jgi:hypothetical protein
MNRCSERACNCTHRSGIIDGCATRKFGTQGTDKRISSANRVDSNNLVWRNV